jgi:hypothetical protein
MRFFALISATRRRDPVTGRGKRRASPEHPLGAFQAPWSMALGERIGRPGASRKNSVEAEAKAQEKSGERGQRNDGFDRAWTRREASTV